MRRFTIAGVLTLTLTILAGMTPVTVSADASRRRPRRPSDPDEQHQSGSSTTARPHLDPHHPQRARGGDWERDCDGDVDNCTIVRPTAFQDCSDGTLYCAYSDLNKTEVWNQAGDPCARSWRTKVTVRNPDGDVIAQDTSPANTC
jgi:hypothetical protein